MFEKGFNHPMGAAFISRIVRIQEIGLQVEVQELESSKMDPEGPISLLSGFRLELMQHVQLK